MNEQINKSELKKQVIKAAMDEYKNTEPRFRSAAQIAKKYGINRKTIIAHAKLMGIEITKKRCIHTLNETVFDKINTEEKAYWLGFLYADGCISSKGNYVQLSLSAKDINHLIKFKNFLETDTDITIREDHQFGTKSKYNTKGEILYNATLIVSSKHLHDSLNDLGCVPNKSLILKFPTKDQVPKEFIYHFLRGYVDGDGTIGMYKHSKNAPHLEESLLIVGTEPFLKGVEQHLGKGHLLQKKNCNKLTFRLGYCCSKANAAAKLMYENSNIHLDRKYKIYREQYATRNRAKSAKAEMQTPR